VAGKQAVDMLEFRTLGEVSDRELEADPLVVLPCGHAFLMSTADGFMDLAAFYSRDASGRWVGMQGHAVVMVCHSIAVKKVDGRKSTQG
jgi:hypothetical protein